MKKLRVALVLLFTLCCSLFLFACRGGDDTSDAILQTIDVTGMKTQFTEADKEFTLGDDFTVTATFTTGEKRVLNADEYTVSKDAVESAFQALNNKNYGSARGTFTVTVSATMEYETIGTITRSYAYDVTIDHNWNADKTSCSVCGATQETYQVNDTIYFDAWTSGIDESKSEYGEHVSKTSGEYHVTYGSIGMGQQISIKGTGIQNFGNTSITYYFPIIGVRNGTKGTAIRNDAWCIQEGPAAAYTWPDHAGADANTADFPGAGVAADWDIYQTGTICTTSDWNDECEFEIIWNYRDDGVMVYTISNLTADKTVIRYMSIPNAVYECVLYGEYFTYHVKEVTYTSNLTLEDFKVTSQPTKLIYAENTMLEINEDKNLNGLVAMAYYNKETSNVSTQIMTYDILADIVNGDKTTTVDLREKELTTEMTNFRVKFGDYEIKLDLTVLPSAIDDVTTSYDFTVGGVQFSNDMASYVYDVIKVDSETVVALTSSGNPNKLSAEQKEALGTTKDYYIAFRLIGANKLIANGLTCSDENAKVWVVDNGVCVVIPVGSADLTHDKTVTVYTNETDITTNLAPATTSGIATRPGNVAPIISLEDGVLKIEGQADNDWSFNDFMLSKVTLKKGEQIYAEMSVTGSMMLVAYTNENPAANNYGKPNGYVFNSSANRLSGENLKLTYTFEELLAMLKGREYAGSEEEISISMLSFYLENKTVATVTKLQIEKIEATEEDKPVSLIPEVPAIATRGGNTATTITTADGKVTITAPATVSGDWTFSDYMVSGVTLKPGEEIRAKLNIKGEAIIIAYTEKDPSANAFGKPNGYLFNSGASHLTGEVELTYTFEELLAMLKSRNYTGSEDEITITMLSFDLNNGASVTIESFYIYHRMELGGKTTVTLDLTGLTMPEVSAVVLENNTTLNGGGSVVVAYYGITNAEEAANYRYSYANISRNYSDLIAEGGAMGGNNLTFSGEIKDGVLLVTYNLPAIDVTAGAINLNQIAAVYSGNTVVATANVSYNLALSGENGTDGYYSLPGNKNAYLKVEGSALYVITLEAGYFLKGTTVELNLNINNEKSTNTAGIAYNVSYTTTQSGITVATANAVSNTMTSVSSVFGTIGNNKDGDYGAIHIAKIDLAKAYGVRVESATEVFYIEFAGLKGSEGEAYCAYKVDDKNVITEISAELEGTLKEVVPDCLVDGSKFYLDEELGFKYGNVTTLATGAHSWTFDSELNAYVCDDCGSVHFVDEKGADTIKKGDNVAAIKDATSRGFAIEFTLNGATADWTAGVINPLKDDGSVAGLIITLPNLDPWNNTAGYTAGINAYPGVTGSTLYNGYAWDAFITKEDVVVTVSVSPVTGISYYKNGVLVLEYPMNSLFGDGVTTIGSFVETLLALVEKNGFKFGEGADLGTVSNLIVYSAALDYGQVMARYDVRMGVISDTTEYYRVGGTLGNLVATENYNVELWADWVAVPDIQKGTCVTFYGSQVSGIGEYWETMLYEFTTNAWWTQRMDDFGWSFGAGFATARVSNSISATDAEGKDVDPGTGNANVWAAYAKIAKNCNWKLEINFSNAGTVTATLTLSSAEGTYTNVSVFKFVGETPATIGLHFTAEAAFVTVGYYTVETATEPSAE